MAAGHAGELKIGAIIQARMKSSRLPGKILLPLPFNSSNALLTWPIRQLKKSRLIHLIVLATSVNKENEQLKNFAAEQDILFYAGSEENVLSRFAEAADKYQLDIFIRITGDNPVIDEKLIDELIDLHVKGNYDYSFSSNLPTGMNVEVVTVAALKEINNRKDLLPSDEEHVTSFFKRKNLYRVLHHHFETGLNKNVRLTVDYPADYAMMNLVIAISKANNLFGVDLIKFIETNYAWVFQVNNHLFQKKQYSSLKEEIVDSVNMLQLQEFNFTLDFLKKKIDEA